MSIKDLIKFKSFNRRIVDTASIFKKQKNTIWTTTELMCPSSPKLLFLILPEIAWGHALVVGEVEHKNILIVLVALLPFLPVPGNRVTSLLLESLGSVSSLSHSMG